MQLLWVSLQKIKFLERLSYYMHQLLWVITAFDYHDTSTINFHNDSRTDHVPLPIAVGTNLAPRLTVAVLPAGGSF